VLATVCTWSLVSEGAVTGTILATTGLVPAIFLRLVAFAFDSFFALLVKIKDKERQVMKGQRGTCLLRFKTKGVPWTRTRGLLERFNTLGVTGQVSGFLEALVVFVVVFWSLLLTGSVMLVVDPVASVSTMGAVGSVTPLETASVSRIIGSQSLEDVQDDSAVVMMLLVFIVLGFFIDFRVEVWELEVLDLCLIDELLRKLDLDRERLLCGWVKSWYMEIM
jgi:hypothetical protein